MIALARRSHALVVARGAAVARARNHVGTAAAACAQQHRRRLLSSSSTAESSSAPPMKHYSMPFTSGNIVFACHADERVTVDVDMCEADGERLRCGTAMPVDAVTCTASAPC